MMLMKTTNANEKLTERAAQFDECVAELSPVAQAELNALAKWISKNMLTDDGGIMSAKELIIQVLKHTN